MTRRNDTTLKEFFAGGAIPTGSNFGDLIDSKLSQNSPRVLNISDDEIVVTQFLHYVDTEGSAPSDDLDTIEGGFDGRLLLLAIYDSTRTVTVNETGNIDLASSTYAMSDLTKFLCLIYRDGTAKWRELFRV